MDILKFIGVIIIIVGFIMKLDTIAVVIVAGIATGFASGMDFMAILSSLGKGFVDTRILSIFFLGLPIFGILERNGLREGSADLMGKLSAATPARVISGYVTIKVALMYIAVGIGGFVQFVRPILYPMAEKAAMKKFGTLSEESKELIKANVSSQENIGNFFGAGLFMVSGGILLITAILKQFDITVDPLKASSSAVPVVAVVLVLVYIQNLRMQRKIAKIEGGK